MVCGSVDLHDVPDSVGHMGAARQPPLSTSSSPLAEELRTITFDKHSTDSRRRISGDVAM